MHVLTCFPSCQWTALSWKKAHKQKKKTVWKCPMINLFLQHLGWMWQTVQHRKPDREASLRRLLAGEEGPAVSCLLRKSGIVRLSPNTEGLLLIAVLHAPVCLVPITVLPPPIINNAASTLANKHLNEGSLPCRSSEWIRWLQGARRMRKKKLKLKG